MALLNPCNYDHILSQSQISQNYLGITKRLKKSTRKQTCFELSRLSHPFKISALANPASTVLLEPLTTSPSKDTRTVLTKQDLVNYFASGPKPKDQWRIGTEHEKIGFQIGSLRPLKYEHIAQLLNSMADMFNWDRVMEGRYVIGLKKGEQSITLEAGGQFELSGAAVETLHDTCTELESHLYQVKAVGEDIGIRFLGMGFQPKWKNEDISLMPKARFHMHKKYFPTVGSLGCDTMFRTGSVQVNLDFSSEDDMIRKFRASLALQPIAIALFATSPFIEGKPNGYLSIRSKAWTDTDKSRTGMLPFVFEDSFGYEQYVDYALDVPMISVDRQNKCIDCNRQTFREFMAGKLEAIPGELPTITDWEGHLKTLYPEVRLKKYGLEMRGADGGPLSMLHALPAFWVGLLYDEISLQNAVDMISDWTEEEREMLRNEAPRTGLNTPFRDGLLRDVAQDVVKWAKDGLERRGLNEAGYLVEIEEVARSGVTLAEKLLDKYYGKWGQCVDPVFEELPY